MLFLHRVLQICCVSGALLIATSAFAEQALRFNRDIRPILSDKCFACHGPAAQEADVDLRLDTREAVMQEEGIIVPGKPEESEFVRRIFTSDVDEIMPPEETHKPLDDQERALLRRWIAEGAEYEPHWAYAPLSRPPIPQIANMKWAKGAIDQFVAARFGEKGVTHVDEADRITLIRRLFI